jgi:membrane protein DedA with SNARE-associated domain
MLLIVCGYVFGIIHKILNNFNWVTWAYVVLMMLVLADVALYLRNRKIEKGSAQANR